MQSGGSINGADVKDLVKDLADLKATVAAQDRRIVDLESRVASLEAGHNTDEEDIKEEMEDA